MGAASYIQTCTQCAAEVCEHCRLNEDNAKSKNFKIGKTGGSSKYQLLNLEWSRVQSAGHHCVPTGICGPKPQRTTLICLFPLSNLNSKTSDSENSQPVLYWGWGL